MTHIAPSSFPRRRHEIELERSPEHSMLVGPQGSHALNDTALALWELCDGATTPDEMIDAICVLFRARRDVVEHDVRAALEEFARGDLIDW